MIKEKIEGGIKGIEDDGKRTRGIKKRKRYCL